MSFGPPSPKQLIFRKTKLWWELFSKLHLPEERITFSSEELIEISKKIQFLELEIWNLQLNMNIDVGSMIDFQKLKKIFFKEKKFMYGVPIKESV